MGRQRDPDVIGGIVSCPSQGERQSIKAGLLTFRMFLAATPSHLLAETVAVVALMSGYSGGTVPDSHGIPY